jgi:hypothetical protein
MQHAISQMEEAVKYVLNTQQTLRNILGHEWNMTSLTGHSV